MQVWTSDIDLAIDWKKYFAIIKLIYNGLDKKNIPENLQSNVVKVKRTSHKTSVSQIHEKENILVQSVYLKEIDEFLLTFQGTGSNLTIPFTKVYNEVKELSFR